MIKKRFSPYYLFDGFPSDMCSTKGSLKFQELPKESIKVLLKDRVRSFIKDPAMVKKINDTLGLDLKATEDKCPILYDQDTFIVIQQNNSELKFIHCILNSNNTNPYISPFD